MDKVLMRGQLSTNGTVDITGYDLDLGRFDCTDGKTYGYADFKFFYVPANELKDIVGTIKVQTEKRTSKNTNKNSKKTDVDTSAQSDSKATSEKADKATQESDVKPVEGSIASV